MTIDASLLRAAAAAAAGAQQYPAAALYVVATPIGNLADLSLRAIHVLGLVDAIACEDTRVTATLLHHFGIERPMVALHRHNEHAAAASVLERLGRSERVAYVSDAGTPGVADPGAALVAAVQAAGYRTLPIPGASSALAAFSVAGDTGGTGFEFVGFVDAKGGERERALLRAAGSDSAQILFEAPHRIERLAETLAAACPSRRLTLSRELTKQFETVVTLEAQALPAWLAADANRRRGEFVIVLHGMPHRAAAERVEIEVPRLLTTLLQDLPLKQAVALAAELSGLPRNRLYQQALALKDAARGEQGR